VSPVRKERREAGVKSIPAACSHVELILNPFANVDWNVRGSRTTRRGEAGREEEEKLGWAHGMP